MENLVYKKGQVFRDMVIGRDVYVKDFCMNGKGVFIPVRFKGKFKMPSAMSMLKYIDNEINTIRNLV